MRTLVKSYGGKPQGFQDHVFRPSTLKRWKRRRVLFRYFADGTKEEVNKVYILHERLGKGMDS